MLWKAVILLCLVVNIHGEEEWRIVKSPQGPVRGRRDPEGVYVFTNIPYATAPTGRNKFTAPLPAPAWLQLVDRPEKGIICPQEESPYFSLKDRIMQEDCLIANVYTPITEEKKLPVLVYVHGGAFLMGYGDMMTAKNFVRDNKVIVVTFNYRLGVHGFLCLGTEAAPGNAGLKDQVALLRWVRKNIASYGGDPENVTIAGYSAGSVSVGLLMLAKSAKGLFNKVILESGAHVASIATQKDPLYNAQSFAKTLNFTDVDNLYALEEFYRNAPLELLLENTFLDRKDASILFGPCVERKSSSAFISDSPVNIIKNGQYKKLPILIGVDNMEGLLHMQKFAAWKTEMNNKFSDFLPATLHFDNEDEKEDVAKAVKEFYFGDKLVSEETILSYIDYFSDVAFSYPTLMAVRLHAEDGHREVYLYEYSFVHKDTPPVPFTDVKGAAHCAQTAAVFDGAGMGVGADESNLSDEYIEMKATIRQMWYNFVIHGKPVPEGSSLPSWPPAGADGSPHMSLGQTVELQGAMYEARARFWDTLFGKYYKDPVAPPAPPHTEL